LTDVAPRLIVVAGIVYDASGRVLIAERPPGRHLAGGWEFPGGKVQAGESDAAALARELREECAITVLASEPYMSLMHAYPDRTVELRLRRVTRWQGTPCGLDGQSLRWLAVAELHQADILDADRPVVDALQRAAAGGT
jgi:8-oxo-dGTP diphosphatase